MSPAKSVVSIQLINNSPLTSIRHPLNTLKSLQHIPKPSDRRISIHLTPAAQRQVRSGHPWLFDKAITKQSHDGKSGDLAVIYDQKKKFLAIGIYDPFSPIRVRILQARKPANINRDWFLDKIQAAAEIREPLLETETNGYRLVHGENDGLPGLIIDRYADTFAIKIYSTAWIPHLEEIISALLEVLPLKRVVLLMNRLSKENPEVLYGLENGDVVVGDPLDDVIVFQENGILFEVDPIKGQKTGFFLDQRENRARVEKISRDKDVLNVFAYTGGFSLYAARGGAKSVTSLDISKPAIEGSARNFALNYADETITNCPHEYIAEDAFKAMERLCREGKLYDVVVIDPPSFAKKQDEVEAAMNAYSRLVKLGLGVLRKGGTLVMASCSSRVLAADFFLMVFDAAESINRPLEKIEHSEHAIDHPIEFHEGAYLKCLFAKG